MEVVRLEATVGIEPTIRVLQTRALPLGYVAASARIPEPMTAGTPPFASLGLIRGSRSPCRLSHSIGLRGQYEPDLEGIGQRPEPCEEAGRVVRAG